MSTKRWLLLGSMLVLATCIVIIAMTLWQPKPGVSKENFDRIEVGMTRAEVVAILGGEANSKHWSGERLPYLWVNKTSFVTVMVLFDAEGLVREKRLWPDERTFWQKVIDYLPWREEDDRPPRPVKYPVRAH